MYYNIAIQLASIVNQIEIKYMIQVSIEFNDQLFFLVVNFIKLL